MQSSPFGAGGRGELRGSAFPCPGKRLPPGVGPGESPLGARFACERRELRPEGCEGCGGAAGPRLAHGSVRTAEPQSATALRRHESLSAALVLLLLPFREETARLPFSKSPEQRWGAGSCARSRHPSVLREDAEEIPLRRAGRPRSPGKGSSIPAGGVRAERTGHLQRAGGGLTLGVLL